MDFAAEAAAVGTVEAWIERLFECKPLTEAEVRQLCDKVRPMFCGFVMCVGMIGNWIRLDAPLRVFWV